LATQSNKVLRVFYFDRLPWLFTHTHCTQVWLMYCVSICILIRSIIYMLSAVWVSLCVLVCGLFLQQTLH